MVRKRVVKNIFEAFLLIIVNLFITDKDSVAIAYSLKGC